MVSNVQTLDCTGTCALAVGGQKATGTPAMLTAITASVASPGSGGNGGVCVMTVADQTAILGQPTQVEVSLTNGHGINQVLGIQTAGTITAIATNPSASGTYTEQLYNNCGVSGAQLYIQYGVVLEHLLSTGQYQKGSTPPGCPASSNTSVSTTSTPGSGLTLNCDTYSSTTSWGTDNQGVLQSAIAQMNSNSTSGTQQCLYFPAGNYLTSPLNTAGANGGNTMAQGYGCFLGDEHYHSNIFLVPGTAGDLFAWNDASNNNSSPPLGNTQTFASSTHPNRAGSAVRNLTIIGDRASTTNQNALAFYGPTSSLRVDDVRITFVRGHAIAAGLPDTSGIGNLTDARFTNLNLQHDGDFTPVSGGAALATLYTGAAGGPGSSGIDLQNIRFYGNYGPSLWLHTTADAAHPATSNTAHISIMGLKAETGGLESVTPPGARADMVLLGDANAAGTANISDIIGQDLELVNQVPGGPFLHIAGPNPARIDLTFLIQATNTTGFAPGLAIDSCRQCAFHTINNQAHDTGLQIGTKAAQ